MSETTVVKGQFGLGQSGGTGKKLKACILFTDMCSIWKKPKFTPRQQENQWMNLMWNTHGQFCDCEDPLTHFMILINRDGPCPKPVEDILNIKCLLTGAPTSGDTTKEEEETGFTDGDLENLFKEDAPEPDDTEEDLR